MNPPPDKPASQWLFGTLLVLLSVLGLTLLFLWLGQRPPGKSRVGWPPPATVTKP